MNDKPLSNKETSASVRGLFDKLIVNFDKLKSIFEREVQTFKLKKTRYVVQ
jgi:hypothetical protein